SLAQSLFPFGQGTAGPPQKPSMQMGDRAGEGLSRQSALLVQGRRGPPQRPLLQTPRAAQSASLVHLPVVAPGWTVPLPPQLMSVMQFPQPVGKQFESQPSLSLRLPSSHSSIGRQCRQSASVVQQPALSLHRPLTQRSSLQSVSVWHGRSSRPVLG